ncbi:MAG: hypothetical protein V1865_01420, partial [bacterium]
MITNSGKFKIKAIVITLLIILISSLALIRPARAIPVEDILGNAWDVAQYLGSKAGSILIQNIGRKVSNQLAYDLATSIGSGGKGQQPLFVTKSWDVYLADMGDKAAGDFIESYANSLMSDYNAQGANDNCEKRVQDCFTNCQMNYDDFNIPDPDTLGPCRDSCYDQYYSCLSRVEDQRKSPILTTTQSPLGKINICNPTTPLASIKIGLGLTQTSTTYQPHCRFSRMKKNWGTFADKLTDMSNPEYMSTLITIFDDPYSSDLGAALVLNTSLVGLKENEVANTRDYLTANKGWLDVRNWDGTTNSPPEEIANRKKMVDQELWDNLDTVTEDIFVDAANIFVNRLAIVAWQNLMGDLSSNTGGSLGYWSGRPVGRSGIENRISSIKEPLFSSGNMLDLTSQLSTCANPEKPGPTSCVMTSNFSDAVTNKMSLIEAINSGRVPADLPFGFDNKGQDTLDYQQGYPYRSLLIMRKYRIIPVGWELAAQKIQLEYSKATLDTPFVARPNGISLGDLVACYSRADEYTGYEEDWCNGLVDPYWVLEIPEHFCAAKGYGSELIRGPDSQATNIRWCSDDKGKTKVRVPKNGGEYTRCDTSRDCCTKEEIEENARACAASCDYKETETTVYRDNNYCADEQSCIKEDENGKCQFYGYCTKERRKWVYSHDGSDESCEPVFNTCRIYKGGETKKSFGFLENTLDFNNCTIDNAGCREYSKSATSYDSDYDEIDWDTNDLIYFDNNAKSCTASNEGCHEFIRVKDDSGVNLIGDGGFENNDVVKWNSAGTITDVEYYEGDYSLEIIGLNGIDSLSTIQNILPSNFNFELDKYYTLSAHVFVISGRAEFGIGNIQDPNSWQKYYSDEINRWEEIVLTVNNDFTINANQFYIRGIDSTSSFYLDNLKLEIGQDSGYTEYGAINKVYEKLLPGYLESSCYKDPTNGDYGLLTVPANQCFDYVRKCNKDEVGCMLFTNTSNKEKVAAQVNKKDYCSEECLGFDVFVQRENNFYSARDEYFVPKTAESCSASAVGCSLFVNLDKANQGGEANEYYTYLRQCVKPDELNANCGEFYTWEGSDESGYQLVFYQLQADINSSINEPNTLYEDDIFCNESIFSLPYNHPGYNPDCRQFYGRDGEVSYHMYSATIACSENCTPYRLADNNIDVTITKEADCTAVNGHWDTDNIACVVCKSGGVWSDDHKGCIYKGVEDGSQSCSSSQVGCSEYVGNFGNNVKVIFNDGFENNTGDWEQGVVSSESTVVGGHSLYARIGYVSKNIYNIIKSDKRYVLSFIAKADVAPASGRPANFIVHVDLRTASAMQHFLPDNNSTPINQATIPLTDKWQYFEVAINDINHEIQLDEKLQIYGNSFGKFYIDNLKLIEVNDLHYLIKNSWETPDVCNRNEDGRPHALFALGCKEYKDQEGIKHYLKSFSQLCQESAVGCELMIDTYNSNSYLSETTNGITTPRDSMAYIIYDKKKTCGFDQQGCERLGKYSNLYERYIDTYILNDPDDYDYILCTAGAVGCEEWEDTSGNLAYFKDPGIGVCEWRQPEGGGSENWYRQYVKRCSISNDVCLDSGDCDSGEKCELKEKEKDDPCNKAPYNNIIPKTLGNGALIYQPSDLVGLCPVEQDTCTEYIDPDSRVSGNLIKEPSLVNLAIQYGWQTIGGEYLQNIKINTNTLYIVGDLENSIRVDYSSNANDGLYYLDTNNNLTGPSSSLNLLNTSEEIYLYHPTANTAIITIAIPDFNGSPFLREAIVDYKLKNTLNTEVPTDPNFVKGQIIFNERSQNGTNKKALDYDSNLSYEDGKLTPSIINNANVLLKVSPDRECAEWLGCKLYMTNPTRPNDNVCYQRGFCNQMDASGQCTNFLNESPVNQTYEASGKFDIYNLSGYSKVGFKDSPFNTDLIPLGVMEQRGDNTLDFGSNNGSFELNDNSGFKNSTGTYEAEVLSEPNIIQQENLGSFLAPDGQAIAKTNKCVSKVISGVSDKDYVFSTYVYFKSGNYADVKIGNSEMIVSNIPAGQAICPFITATSDESNTAGCDSSGSTWMPIATDADFSKGKWVRITKRFTVKSNYLNYNNQIRIEFCTDGNLYFDDIRIQPGLEVRDEGAEFKYLHSDCRLYPKNDSLSCDYYDNNNIRNKGWEGYCLEKDPKNENVCLLWYPLDKVASEAFEGGMALNFPGDIYYCIDAEDQCSSSDPTIPEMYCKQFIKVDKDSYWRGRISGEDDYKIPKSILTDGDYNINFGVTD